MAADVRQLRRRAIAFGALLCLALTVNNLLPYLGVRDDSCQTMFSGLDWAAESNNHLFVPQHAVSDLWRYWYDVRVELDPPAPEHGRVADLRGFLDQPTRRLNDEAVRVVVRQICERGHVVRLTRRAARDAEVEVIEDACADPRLAPRWWIPVRLYEVAMENAPEPTPSELAP
jgi:hypothetical protein